MKTSDVFKVNRFVNLFKQNLIHNYQVIVVSLIALCGGLFLLFLLIQFGTGFRPWEFRHFISSFIFLFLSIGIIYIGTAFPRLRTSVKRYTYLLTPASHFEKYLFEIISRLILFIVALPLIYMVVYTLEGILIQFLHPSFVFQPIWELSVGSSAIFHDLNIWVIILIANIGFTIYIIPFVGANIFMKHPLLKTI